MLYKLLEKDIMGGEGGWDMELLNPVQPLGKPDT